MSKGGRLAKRRSWWEGLLFPFAKIVVLDENCEKEEIETGEGQHLEGVLVHAGRVKLGRYAPLRCMQVSTTGPLGSVVERVTSNDKVISSILIVGSHIHFLSS